MIRIRFTDEPHFRARFAEWIAALQFTLAGLVLAMPGDTFALPIFDRVAGSEATWSAGLLIVGAARLAGLFVNGRTNYTAIWTSWMRAVGAAVGFFVFAIMFWFLLISALSGTAPSLLMALILPMVLAEMRSFGYAMEDAGRAHGGGTA